MGGCVKLKIVTDVRQGSASDTFKWQTLFILYRTVCGIGSHWRNDIFRMRQAASSGCGESYG